VNPLGKRSTKCTDFSTSLTRGSLSGFVTVAIASTGSSLLKKRAAFNAYKPIRQRDSDNELQLVALRTLVAFESRWARDGECEIKRSMLATCELLTDLNALNGRAHHFTGREKGGYGERPNAGTLPSCRVVPIVVLLFGIEGKPASTCETDRISNCRSFRKTFVERRARSDLLIVETLLGTRSMWPRWLTHSFEVES
jgi:hypothetical protein